MNLVLHSRLTCYMFYLLIYFECIKDRLFELKRNRSILTCSLLV